MNIKEIMWGPRVKIERAKDHINNLVRLSYRVPKHLYEVVSVPAAEPGRFNLTYRPKTLIR